MANSHPIENQPLPNASWRLWLSVAVLCVAVVVCYLPAVGAPWVFDSIKLGNEAVYRDVTPIWVALSRSTRSFTEWTFAVQYQLFGPSRLAYSLVNIGIHLLATFSLWGVFRRTLRLDGISQSLREHADAVAFAITLLWAIHPLQTQAVTYTIQRHESLMGAMFFLTLYLFIRGCQSERSAAGWYLGAIAACVVGMASKTVMVTCPVVVLLYDTAFLPGGIKTMVRRRWWVYMLMFTAAAWGIFDVRAALDPKTEGQSAGIGLEVVTPWEYLRTQPQVILHYLRLVFWPDRLSLDHMWPIATSPPQIWGLGLVILAMLFVGLVGLRFWPKTAFLVLSFFVVLAPTSSFVPILDLAVEHRMYVPLAAIVALAVCGCWWLTELLQDVSARRLARVGVLVVVAVALAGRTFLRNVEYQSPTKLWESALRISPHNYRAHHVLGDYARDRREWKTAQKHYEKSIEIDDTYPQAHQALASLLAVRGQYEEAEKEFTAALRLAPQYGLALDNWGNMYARRGDFARARGKYQAAVRVEPGLASAHTHLGMIEFKERNYAAAKRAFEDALEISSNSWDAKLHLAMILAAAPDEALRDPTKALSIAETLIAPEQPASAPALQALGMAQAATGNFSFAVQTLRQAKHLAMGANDLALVEELKAQEVLYGEQQAYRLP